MLRAQPGFAVFGEDPIAAGAAGRRLSRWWRWVAPRWPAFASLAVGLAVGIPSTLSGLRWIGQPFPGFFLMEPAVVPTVGLYRWTGMEAGVPFHGRVVAVDGHPVRNAAKVYRYVRTRPAGTPIRYDIEKDGRVDTRTVPTMRFTTRDYWPILGLLAVCGFTTIIGGAAVGMLQPMGHASRAFVSQSFWNGAFGLTAASLYDPTQPWLGRFHFLTETTFPAAFIHMALVFPVVRRVVERRPVVQWIPYGIAAALAAAILRWFYADPPSTLPLHLTYAFSAASIVWLICSSVYAYVENRGPTVRAQLQLVVPGIVFGAGLALYGFLNIAQFGGDFPINFVALTPFLFYLAVGYAIIRRDLFDVDALVKQALVYGALTLLVIGVYSLGAGSLITALPGLAEHVPGAASVGVLVVVALLIDPLRARVQDVIDRTFFRGRVDYRRTVRELSAALATMLDLDEILALVGSTLMDGLQLRTVSVLLWAGESEHWRYDAARRRMVRDGAASAPAIRELLLHDRARNVWSLPHADDATAAVKASALSRDCAELGACLLVPLAVGDEVAGVLALGPRRSGRSFTRDEIDLIATLGAQTAVAVQNARSYRALEALNVGLEDKVRERTTALQQSNAELENAYDELQAAQSQLVQSEKMASLGVLVAGVAHEINNPVSFIAGNIDTITETVDRASARAAELGADDLTKLLARVRKMSEIIGRGAERATRIVNDLRTFSRLGDARTETVDVHEGLEVTLRLLHPKWSDRITIHRDFGRVPPVQAASGQLNQVFMNLLSNACDAIAASGNIWIATSAEDGRVAVAIRDDGSGIDAERLPRIFDPFFTTKPQGQGTGLGLSISHGIVVAHGGTIEVASTPGQGTTFTVYLPHQDPAAGVAAV